MQLSPPHPAEAGEQPLDPTGSDPASPVDLELAARLGQAVTRLVRAVTRARAHGLAHAGGTDFAAFPLLIALAELGPVRATTLADAVLSDPSTISRQVAHLAELGYVERRPDPRDRRASLLAMTDAGRAALAERRRTRDEYLARLTASWSERDRRRLAALVERLASDIVEHVQQAPEPPHRGPGRSSSQERL